MVNKKRSTAQMDLFIPIATVISTHAIVIVINHKNKNLTVL